METATLQIDNGIAQLSGDLTFATVTGLYDRMNHLSASNGMPGSIDLANTGRIDSAGLALLLEWPNERSYSVQGILSQKKYWSEKASKLRQKDLLSLARQVLVACQTLQAISHVSPKVRNKTQVRTRLKNVKVWLEMLRAVMIEEERLKDITHPAPRLR